MQASSSGSLSLFSAMTDLGVLVRQQGITAIWRGLTPTLWRDVPFSGRIWEGRKTRCRVVVERIEKEIERCMMRMTSSMV